MASYKKDPVNEKMKAVIYARYSSDKQQEQSIDGQLRVCYEYCERHKIIVVRTYIDRALSAFKDNEKRVEFNRMIKDAANGDFQAVVVFKMDRFARNVYAGADAKFKLHKNGVKVISATEAISEGPEGIIMDSVLSSMAEYYSLNLSENVRRGMHESAIKANSTGGTIPYGYKIIDKKYCIDTDAAPIVYDMFKMAASGSKGSHILAEMKSRGIRNQNNKPLSLNTILRILRSPKYKGTYKYKDVVVEDGMPAIVDQKLFDEVQAKMAENTKSRTSKAAEYILSGKLICGQCQSSMVGDSVRK
ncbi:MAG: recombinase family protein, partial [Chloroflexi bacterium]|nr:recombinase family protein [Chloroflexota bacterium]